MLSWLKRMLQGARESDHARSGQEDWIFDVLKMTDDVAKARLYQVLEKRTVFRAEERLPGTVPPVGVPDPVRELFTKYERVALPESCVDVDPEKFMEVGTANDFVRIAYAMDGAWVVLNKETGAIDVVDGEFDPVSSRSDPLYKSIYHWLLTFTYDE